MWLWRLLFPIHPMPGHTWRFHGGNEVTITNVQPYDVMTGLMENHPEIGVYNVAHVAYRTANGEHHMVPYKGFARSDKPIPSYLLVET